MIKKLLSVCLIVILLLLLSSCSEEPIVENEPTFEIKQLLELKEGDTIAVVDTSKGEFRIALFEDIAPLAVQNFTGLVKDEYYNELTFHRVIADTLVQAGDHTGVGDGGKSIFNDPYENEPSKELFHFTGAVGIANDEADQNYSQFYIISDGIISTDMETQMEQGQYPTEVIDAYKQLGGRPTIDGKYTIMGQVYEGLDVVREIAAVKTDEYDRPERDVVIKSITIESYTEQQEEQQEDEPQEDEKEDENDTDSEADSNQDSQEG